MCSRGKCGRPFGLWLLAPIYGANRGRTVSLDSLAKLDSCDNCGLSRWIACVHADGEPFLRCGECGHRTNMPRQLQRRLRVKDFVREKAS